jgi:hypothetical protein
MKRLATVPRPSSRRSHPQTLLTRSVLDPKTFARIAGRYQVHGLSVRWGSTLTSLDATAGGPLEPPSASFQRGDEGNGAGGRRSPPYDQKRDGLRAAFGLRCRHRFHTAMSRADPRNLSPMPSDRLLLKWLVFSVACPIASTVAGMFILTRGRYTPTFLLLIVSFAAALPFVPLWLLARSDCAEVRRGTARRSHVAIRLWPAWLPMIASPRRRSSPSSGRQPAISPAPPPLRSQR